MNDNVTLRVNGREWNGWTSVRIGAGIERLARDFSVEITRQWPGDEGITTLQPRIKNGSKVEVLIGDELVITGWVEATPVRYDARSVSTGIAGRSLTADLIDCAAEPTQFNGRSLVQIAQALAAPFGIEVVNSDAPSGVIPDVQPDHGETVIEVINKILGQQQALAYDDPHGRLVIGGIGSTRAHTALVLGENILSCDTEKSIRERFSVLRGEFIRGWDDGRGIDSGRNLLSAQNDAIQNIVGSFGRTQLFRDVLSSGPFSQHGQVLSTGLKEAEIIEGYGAYNWTFDASRSVRTASETRSRNIAFNYIVRAA
ncbi:hypothetical protein NFK39_17715 [Escherichia coli]|nr:hypothetical protein NFK39_17715 [Escherichia coli]